MKTLFIALMLLFHHAASNLLVAQSDISGLSGVGHAGGNNTTYYCGWDGNTAFPLNIQHLGTDDINFKIGNTPTQVMTIKGTSYMSGAPGSVGIGTATPLALLNVNATTANQANVFRTDVPSGVGAPTTSFWCMFHGASSEFRIFHDNTVSLFGIGSQSNESVIFTIAGTQRMILTTGGNLGINITAPSYKLHVGGTAGVDDMPAASTNYFVVSSGSSGGQLKIRNLNVTSACSGLSNPLNYISKWNSNSSTEFCQTNIYEDNTTKNVMVDYDNNTSEAKLKVKFTSSSSTQEGILSSVSTGSGTGTTTGIRSYVTGGSGSTTYYGVKSQASGNAATDYVYAVWGKAIGTNGTQTSRRNFGVYGWALNGGTGQNVGVFGKVDNVGSGSGDWAGYFEGDVNTTSAYYTVSDEILKQNLEPLNNALTKLLELNPKTYNFDTVEYFQRGLPSGDQIGLVAQEVEEVFPQAVRKGELSAVLDESGNEVAPSVEIKFLNYGALIPVLIGAVQEQNARIEFLNEKVTDLESLITDCCSGFDMRNSENDSPENVNQQIVDLKSISQNYLGQSVPNPHKDQCTIPYYVEQNVSNADIIFYDELGWEINRVQIIGRGTGQLTILSSQLTDGVYAYTLITDGKVVDTKRMVKQQ